jgi:hypothetical protein
MPNGMILNGQEKFLSNKYSHYNSLTVEYMQNPMINEIGDWFKLAPQFYICGYFNRDMTNFDKYILVDWPKLVICTNNNIVTWRDNNNKDGRARASFKYVDFNDIPDCCTIDKVF